LEVELLVDDSVKGFSRSISCGFDPDTGKFRRFSSTLRSLTANANAMGLLSLSAFRDDNFDVPFMSSNLPKGLNGGCSEGLFEELDGAGLAAFVLLTLPASLAPLLVSDNGFCAAGKIICGY